jgi:hypothetical protein
LAPSVNETAWMLAAVPGLLAEIGLVLKKSDGAAIGTVPGANQDTVISLVGSAPKVRCTCSGAVPLLGMGLVGPSA